MEKDGSFVREHWWVPLAVGAGTGVLGYLVFPGVGLWWLAPLQFVPLLSYCSERPGSQVLAVTTLSALVMCALSLHWLPLALVRASGAQLGVGIAAYTVSVVSQSIPSIVGIAFALVLRTGGVPLGLGWALGLVAAESYIPVVFPYSHAVSLVPLEGGRLLLSHFGRDLSALYVVALSWGVLHGVERARRGQWAKLVLAVAGIFSPLLLATVFARQPTTQSKALTFGLLQAAFPVEAARADPDGVYAWHREASRGAFRESEVDLLLWGESTLAVPRGEDAQRLLVAQTAPIPVLFGSVVRDAQSGGLTNSLLLSSCRTGCRYDKQRLVPYVESASAPFGARFQQRPGRFVAGTGSLPIRFESVSIGGLICFEGLFPARFEELARAGAGLVVNVVSDGWMASSVASRSMEALTRLNAVEIGMPLVRLVTLGPSGAWSAEGRLLHRTRADVPQVALVRVSVAARPSWYFCHQAWMRLALLGILAVSLGWTMVSRSRKSNAFMRGAAAPRRVPTAPTRVICANR